MSSLADVVRSTCRIQDAGGRPAGSGFVALDGRVITCHHVVRGLREIAVLPQGADAALPACYDAGRSAPGSDVAVLDVPGLDRAPVQLGELRTGVDVAGVGFRPSELAAEPEGRVFSGRLTPGQELRLPAPPLAGADLPPWAREPGEYHAGEVANLAVAGGLEPGVSGGPVFDTDARRVVGLFRAIEGAEQAYVLPLHLLDETWPDLLPSNRSLVADDALDALVERYGIGLVREGARPQRPQPWRDFEPLLALHRRFAGRAGEIARLDRFVAAPELAYVLVTGPSGYGKTALLANWGLRLVEQGRTVVVHFITPRIDAAVSARDVLGGLCRQLMAVHRLGGDLPVVDGDLRHLLADLLRFEPAGDTELVVVVDGLDEAIGSWRSEGLWPDALPAGVHVVLSARSIADMDWPARLGLPAGATELVALDRLSREEIGQLVESVLGRDDAITERVATVTEGDPFYVRDVVDDLARAGPAAAGRLADHPVGHVQYLRDWWIEARAANPGPGFADLMGTLAVARAPLGEAELARIAPDDALTGGDLPGLIDGARRYLEGTEADGYRLAHHRIEEFVRATMADAIAVHRRRLSDFCLRAPDAASSDRERRYALRHALGHLLDEGRVDDAYALLSAQWITRHFKETGSYRLLLDQFGQLAAHIAEHPELGRQPLVVPLVGARETARDLISSLPGDLLVAWTDLGGAEQVLAVCDAFGSFRGEAAEPLVAAGGAVLRTDDAALHPQAVALLGRAIGMLPSVRTTRWMLDRLDELGAAIALAGPDAAVGLVDQLAAVADAMSAGIRRALTLAHAAAAAARAGDAARATGLLAAARAEAADLDPAGDAVLTQLIALPAARLVEPESFRHTLGALAEQLRLWPRSTVEGHLHARWLRCWEPERDAWAPEVLASASYSVLVALCDLGDPTRAIAELEDALAVGDAAAAQVVAGAAPALRRLGTVDAELLLARALAIADPAVAAIAHARLGDWDAALAAAPEPLDGTLAQELAEHVTTRAVAAELAAAARELDADRRAELDAALARRLAGADQEAAGDFLQSALQRSLATLPEGDADLVCRLTAVAHALVGEDDAAERVAARVAWPHSELEAYAGMIAAARERSGAPLARWAGIVCERLAGWQDDTFRADALAAAADCAESLAGVAPQAARDLLSAAEAGWRDDGASGARLIARVGALWWGLDPAKGARALDRAADLAAADPGQRPGYLEALGGLPAEAAERRVRALAAAEPDDDPAGRRDAFRADAARAAALARFAPEEALAEVRRLVAVLPAAAAVEEARVDSLLVVVQMFRDLTGGTTELPDLVRAAAGTCAAVADADAPGGDDAARALATTALEVAAGMRGAVVSALCEGLGRSDAACAGLGRWLPAQLEADERAAAVTAILRAEPFTIGRFEAAMALTAGAAGEEELIAQVMAALDRAGAPPGTVLERTLVAEDRTDIARTVVEWSRGDERDEALVAVFADLSSAEFQEPRAHVLGSLAPLAVPLLLATGGTGALDQMVDAFHDLDDRLREAARLSAEP